MCVESTRDKVVRILFLIKLQMAVEVEPKLPELLGSEIRWEEVSLGAGQAGPDPPPPPASPEPWEFFSLVG